MTAPSSTTQALIDRLILETGASDAVTAIRRKAETALDAYVETFGEPDALPFDLFALASFLGIKLSEEVPTFSTDAEIAPDGDGNMQMRVNPDRPATRIRFSVAHEIAHTFFPDHQSHLWPRADSRYRDLSNPDDYLEMLCDVGAAELVLPRRWFSRDAAKVGNAGDLIALAGTYGASRHATVRRFAELHPESVAAVFYAWKLKPTQVRALGKGEQGNLFGISPDQLVQDSLRLRVEYAIPSLKFIESGHFIPRDKSIDNDGPIYAAAASGKPFDGECHLDLGQSGGTYQILAVPLWTADGTSGPNAESSVVAAIRPLSTPKRGRKRILTGGPQLFE